MFFSATYVNYATLLSLSLWTAALTGRRYSGLDFTRASPLSSF
jgi:hypothetical protein